MMKVLVNLVKKNTEKTMVMNVNSVKFNENMVVERDEWNKEKRRADGLLIVDCEGNQWCIPNVNKETADAIAVELFETDKCDLRPYGICQ